MCVALRARRRCFVHTHRRLRRRWRAGAQAGPAARETRPRLDRGFSATHPVRSHRLVDRSPRQLPCTGANLPPFGQASSSGGRPAPARLGTELSTTACDSCEVLRGLRVDDAPPLACMGADPDFLAGGRRWKAAGRIGREGDGGRLRCRACSCRRVEAWKGRLRGRRISRVSDGDGVYAHGADDALVRAFRASGLLKWGRCT